MNTYKPSPQTQQLLADLEAATGATYGIYWNWHEVGPMPAAADDAMYYARLLALRARMARLYMALGRGGVALVNPSEQSEGMVAYENPDLTGAFRAWLSGSGAGWVKDNGEMILARGLAAPSDMVRQFQTGQELAIPTVVMRPELLAAPVVTAPPAPAPAPAAALAPAAPQAAVTPPPPAGQVPSGPVVVYSGGEPAAPVQAGILLPAGPSREGGPYWWQGALIRTTPATVMPVVPAEPAAAVPVVMQEPPSDWWTWVAQNQALAFGGAAVAVVMLAALASGGRR